MLDNDDEAAANHLCLESWRTWYTLLQYDLAVDSFTYVTSIDIVRVIVIVIVEDSV